MRITLALSCALGTVFVAACAGAQILRRGASSPVPESARQLVVVVTPGWDTTSGTMRRFVRAGAHAPWRRVGPTVPVVVGTNGLAWADDALGASGDPHKREGDGRSPAGVLPLDGAFGFAAANAESRVKLPYMQLTAGSECVDDTTSAHYNRVVNRDHVAKVDWASSEHMRRIAQYQVGVLVGYNTQPVKKGRGSCIFLHIWDGPGSSTAGCTAFPRADVDALLAWLDPKSQPVLVQLPAAEYVRLKRDWALP